MKRFVALVLCFTIMSLGLVIYAEDDTYTIEEILGHLSDNYGTRLDINYVTTYGSNIRVNESNGIINMRITQLGDRVFSQQAKYNVSGGNINKDDIVFMSYKVRAISSEDISERGLGYTRFRVNNDSQDILGTNFFAPVGEGWVQYYKAVPSAYSYTESANLFFILGLSVQEIEVKDMSIINFGNSLDLDRFPKMSKDYEGIKENAHWRIEANKRIEEIRKSDITINITDNKGNPVNGVEVNVNQKKHKYAFGSIMSITRFYDTNEQRRDAYLERFKQMFNRTGFENAMKYHRIEENEDNIEGILNWAQENNMDVRGHTLIWLYNHLTEEEKQLVNEEPEALRGILANHVDKYTEKYSGRIASWDVVNEVNTNREFVNILGQEELINWFNIAGENDPNASLVLNDYGILSYDNAKQNFHYDMAKYLLDNGAPITTIGMQAHIGAAVSPERIIYVLDKFSDLGLDIEITEFTYEDEDEEFQAKYMRDFMTAVFSHPSTSSFFLWGFAEGLIGRRSAALCRSDLSFKPNGEVWMDLIYNQWWTNESGETDDKGIYETRAFHGTHEITVEKDGAIGVFEIEHEASPKELNIVFKDNVFIIEENDKEYNYIEGLNLIIDRENRVVKITGDDNFLGAEEMTILITDANEEIVYLDQITRDSDDGSFDFEIPLSNFLQEGSQYLIKIGNQSQECVRLWIDSSLEMTALNINKVIFKNSSSEEIESLDELGSQEEISIEVSIHSKEEQVMLVGVYDSEDSLVKIIMADSLGENNGDITFNTSIVNDISYSYIKLFLWDSLINIRPFASAIIFD